MESGGARVNPVWAEKPSFNRRMLRWRRACRPSPAASRYFFALAFGAASGAPSGAVSAAGFAFSAACAFSANFFKAASFALAAASRRSPKSLSRYSLIRHGLGGYGRRSKGCVSRQCRRESSARIIARPASRAPIPCSLIKALGLRCIGRIFFIFR